MSPLCHGAGKVERAKGWASERGIDLADCYFYTDSYSDAPMLKVVGFPRIGETKAVLGAPQLDITS